MFVAGSNPFSKTDNEEVIVVIGVEDGKGDMMPVTRVYEVGSKTESGVDENVGVEDGAWVEDETESHQFSFQATSPGENSVSIEPLYPKTAKQIPAKRAAHKQMIIRKNLYLSLWLSLLLI